MKYWATQLLVMHQMIIHLNDQQIDLYCYSSYSLFIRTQITERYGRAMMIGIVTSRYNNDKDKWGKDLEIATKVTLFSWLSRPLCSPLPLKEKNDINPCKGTAFIVVIFLNTRCLKNPGLSFPLIVLRIVSLTLRIHLNL